MKWAVQPFAEMCWTLTVDATPSSLAYGQMQTTTKTIGLQTNQVLAGCVVRVCGWAVLDIGYSALSRCFVPCVDFKSK